MGGDLNLKKSWHPLLLSNQRRVWEEEKKALDERKRIEQMMKERQEERQIQELQEMQEAAGGKKRLNRVDWMYSGPSAGQAGTTEEMEGYLLGKRRIDGLIKSTENRKLEKASGEDSFMALQKANTARDTASKIREDPMLEIKKKEQAAYEALMNDPVKRRLMLKAAGGEFKSSKSKEERKRRHHDDHYSDRRYSRKSQRREEDDRHSGRSRRHHRRRSDSSSYSRSPQPYRERQRSPSRRRSRSPIPYRRRRSDSSFHQRSPSPYYQRRSPSQHRRPPTPPERDAYPMLKQSKSWHNSVRQNSSPHERFASKIGEIGDRAAKLAAMQQNASDLDIDREKRIAAIAAHEEAEKEADEIARARSAKYGGRGDFVNGLHRKAGELDIGERMRRVRQGMGKEGRDDD